MGADRRPSATLRFWVRITPNAEAAPWAYDTTVQAGRIAVGDPVLTDRERSRRRRRQATVDLMTTTMTPREPARQ